MARINRSAKRRRNQVEATQQSELYKRGAGLRGGEARARLREQLWKRKLAQWSRVADTAEKLEALKRAGINLEDFDPSSVFGKDGDGVEGVQLYVCGSDGELELLALEGKAGGRRWHLKARAADLVTAPNDARYPEQACRIAREAADGCSRGDRLTASIEHGALKVSIKRKIGGTGVTASRLARVLAATLVPVRGDAAAGAGPSRAGGLEDFAGALDIPQEVLDLDPARYCAKGDYEPCASEPMSPTYIVLQALNL